MFLKRGATLRPRLRTPACPPSVRRLSRQDKQRLEKTCCGTPAKLRLKNASKALGENKEAGSHDCGPAAGAAPNDDASNDIAPASYHSLPRSLHSVRVDCFMQ